MSDLIDKAEALRIVEEYEVLHDQIAALPARGVGVDVEEVARAIYDAMRFERKDKTPEWVKGGNSDAQVEARSTAARILAAPAPADAAQVREAAQVIAKNGAEATAAAMILHIAETLRAKGKAVLTTGDDFGAQVLQYADAIGEARDD